MLEENKMTDEEVKINTMISAVRLKYPNAAIEQVEDWDVGDWFWVKSEQVLAGISLSNEHNRRLPRTHHKTTNEAWIQAYNNLCKNNDEVAALQSNQSEQIRETMPREMIFNCPTCGIAKAEYGGTGWKLHMDRCARNKETERLKQMGQKEEHMNKVWDDSVNDRRIEKEKQSEQIQLQPAETILNDEIVRRVKNHHPRAILCTDNPEGYFICDNGSAGSPTISGDDYHDTPELAWGSAWKIIRETLLKAPVCIQKIKVERAENVAADSSWNAEWATTDDAKVDLEQDRIKYLKTKVREVYPSAIAHNGGKGWVVGYGDNYTKMTTLKEKEIDAWREVWNSISKPDINTEGFLTDFDRQIELTTHQTPESIRETQHGGLHYKSLAIQPAEYCHRNQFQFCESEAIKYLSRFRSKKGVEDIKKAIHFCQMILDMEYGIQSVVHYSDKE